MKKLPPWYLLIPAVLVAVSVGVPVAYLMVRGLAMPWEEIKATLFRWRLVELGINTLLLSGGVLLVSTAIAWPAAWLTTRTTLFASRLWAILLVTPLAVPNYLMAYSLRGLGGAGNVVDQLTGWKMPMLSGYWGALLALSFYFMPFMFFNLRSVMLRMDQSLIDSASSLGVGPWRRLVWVTVPQLLPGFAAGALIVLLSVIGDFGVVSLMNYETFSLALYIAYENANARTFLQEPAWYAMILMVMSLGVLALDALILHRLHLARSGALMWRKVQRHQLGWWQGPAALLLSVVILFSVAVPVFTMVHWSMQMNWELWWEYNVEDEIAEDTWFLPLEEVQKEEPRGSWNELRGAIRDSLLSAIPSALLAVLIAIPVAWLSQRYIGWVSRITTRLALLGYAIPCLAYGLAMIFFVLNLLDPGFHAIFGEEGLSVDYPAWLTGMLEPMYQWLWEEAAPESYSLPGLYQTGLILVAALAFHYLAEALGPIRAGLFHASPRLEEAAHSLGAGKWRTFWKVSFPLLRSGVVVALALVFMSAMKELPLTWLLKPHEFQTLATQVYDHAAEADFIAASPIALSIVGISAVFLAILLYHRRKEDA